MVTKPVYLDPVIDSMLRILIALAAEVYVLRDRQRALEELLQARGLIHHEEVERSTPEKMETWRRDRDAFMARLFETIKPDSE